MTHLDKYVTPTRDDEFYTQTMRDDMPGMGGEQFALMAGGGPSASQPATPSSAGGGTANQVVQILAALKQLAQSDPDWADLQELVAHGMDLVSRHSQPAQPAMGGEMPMAGAATGSSPYPA